MGIGGDEDADLMVERKDLSICDFGYLIINIYEREGIRMKIERNKKMVMLLLCISLLTATSESFGQQKALIIGMGAEPPNLLPSSSSQPTEDRTYSVYEPLFWLDKDTKLIPRLATKWEVIDGNKKWRVYLRKNVVFHNGEKFTAEDVAFSIDFTKNPKNKLGKLSKVRGYTYNIIDDYTIDVLREDGKPVDPLLPAQWFGVQMISKATVIREGADQLARKLVVGTGPYQFMEWKDGEQITLKAFDKYWGGRPKIDKIIFKTIPEIATRVIALKTGDVDMIVDVPPEEMKAIEADRNLKILRMPSVYNMQLQIRSDIPPFQDDLNLRRAVAHAIDSESLCKNVLGGYAIPVGSPNPNGTFGKNPNLKPYKYDPVLAKEYLKKSNYKGQEIGYASSNGRYFRDIEVNTAISQMLKDIGLNVKLELFDWPTFEHMCETKHMKPIVLQGWAARTGDAVEIIYNCCHSSAAEFWYGKKGIPGLDELLDIARTNFDLKIRKDALEKAEQIMHDYVAHGMNYTPIKIYGARKNVKWNPRRDETIVVSVEDDK